VHRFRSATVAGEIAPDLLVLADSQKLALVRGRKKFKLNGFSPEFDSREWNRPVGRSGWHKDKLPLFP
jgi:hypothetical protein